MATLLETVHGMEGTPQEVEREVLRRLAEGSLRLSGNFRGQEHRFLAPSTAPGHSPGLAEGHGHVAELRS